MGEDVRSVLPGFQGIAFGLVDGLITMLGIIIGISRATSDPRLVILAGIVGGVSNGFANSIGLYASELAERGQQIQARKRGEESHVHTLNEILIASGLAFVSCLVALVLPIVPFFYFSINTAIMIAFVVSTALLFILGFEVGRVSYESRLRMGLQYAFAGVFGAIICYWVGDMLQNLVSNGLLTG